MGGGRAGGREGGRRVRRWLGDARMCMAWLTGSVKKKRKKKRMDGSGDNSLLSN